MRTPKDRLNNLNTLYQDYLRKVSSLEVSAKSMDNMFDAEWLRIHDESQKRKVFDKEDLFYSIHNFIFHTIDSEVISYDLREFDLEDSLHNLIDTWNRHYQILLVQAFEAFSEFFKSFYEELTSIDPRFTKPKKRTIHHIRSEIFKVLPALEVYEVQNELGANFKFLLPFIEKLRHLIAHAHGEFIDFDKFKRETLKVNQLYNNGNYDTIFDQYFNSFIRNKNDRLEVAMMSFPKESKGLFKVHQNRFDMLNGDLLAYAEFMKRTLTREVQ